MAGRPHPLIIGHRGASGYRPEHTASAYQLAFVLGADAVEPDIVATRDGVLVIRHENEISGTTDVSAHPEFADRRTAKTVDGKRLHGWFTEDFTWAELSTLHARERIPKLRSSNAGFDDRLPLLRLRDLFALVDAEDAGRSIGMVAEIKHATYFDSIGLPLADLFAAELAAAGWATDDERLTIESFELTVLDQLREHGIGAPRVFLLEKAGSPADAVAASGSQALKYADFLTETGLRDLEARVQGISVDKAMLLEQDAAGEPSGFALVERAHGHDLRVFTWTLRPENHFLSAPFRSGVRAADFGAWEEEWDLILSTGVDGVFTDHPDLAVLARDDRSD